MNPPALRLVPQIEPTDFGIPRMPIREARDRRIASRLGYDGDLRFVAESRDATTATRRASVALAMGFEPSDVRAALEQFLAKT